jgi:hypothetical protein
MLIKQNAAIRQLNFIKKNYIRLFLFLCIGFIYHSHSLSGNEIVCKEIFNNLEGSKDKKITALQLNKQPIVYYLNISDFAQSFIEIPTSNVLVDSSTISSKYLAGRAAIYNTANEKVGTCSASFLCMQNADGIYTDISNFLTVDSGLIVSWFTPTTLINLELDSIIHSMVTECIVLSSTKVGVNPFYGQTFDLIVSSDDQKIYFKFTRTGMIF